MHLKKRIADLEVLIYRDLEMIPPELAALPPDQRELAIEKERVRGMEQALFECRGTPSHCWVFDDRQIGQAVQMILDEAYGEIRSPFDQAVTEEQRQEIEQVVREQMRQPSNERTEHRRQLWAKESDIPAEPIRDLGRRMREQRQAAMNLYSNFGTWV